MNVRELVNTEKLRHPTRSFTVRRAVSRVVRGNRLGYRSKQVSHKRYLDIGTSGNVNDTFISLDYEWHPSLDICWDVTKGIPIADASVDGVYSEHCIEHLDFRDGAALLAECRRVLRPGGTIRIIVPDVELYARRYVALLDGVSDEPMPLHEFDGVDGLYTPAMSVNRIFQEFGHRFIYDFATLQAMLERNGFVDVAKESFRTGRDPTMLQDAADHATESLYVEASKGE
jgi:predicted SAM-dependent methyltransferase